MGLFSLFKKGKDNAAGNDEAAARLAVDSTFQRQQAHVKRQRDIARATALKIDAIEAAMEADIFNDAAPAGAAPLRPRLSDTAANTVANRVANTAADADHPDTLPLLDAPTTLLLADDDMPAPAPNAATAPVIDESAILYANGQADVAGHLLAGAIADAAAAGPPAQQDRLPWWLLFDLYQATGQQDAFDQLSIDYASTFETSPPPWRDMRPAAAAAEAAPRYSGATPSHVFAAALDARSAAPLQQWRAQAGEAPVLRLDFSRITTCDDAGCAVLLAHLQALVAARRELIVVAAEQLVQLLRASTCVGRKDDGAATWLLLLELLQLLNHEKAFEEASMDYCVTFEVSPPSFTPPYQVATAARQRVEPTSERFMLPSVIDGDLAPLLAAITAHGAQYHALVFDCSHLARMEFAAAGQLLSHVQGWLQPAEAASKAASEPASGPRRVEFREVNHLVAALMRLLGYTAVGRIFAHKY